MFKLFLYPICTSKKFLLKDFFFRCYLLKAKSIINIGKKLFENTALSYFNKAKATLMITEPVAISIQWIKYKALNIKKLKF